MKVFFVFILGILEFRIKNNRNILIKVYDVLFYGIWGFLYCWNNVIFRVYFLYVWINERFLFYWVNFILGFFSVEIVVFFIYCFRGRIFDCLNIEVIVKFKEIYWSYKLWCIFCKWSRLLLMFLKVFENCYCEI